MNRRFLSIYIFAGVIFILAGLIIGATFGTDGVVSPGGEVCLAAIDAPSIAGPACDGATTDALRSDAAWGAALAVAAAASAFGIFRMHQQNPNVGVWVAVGAFVVGVLIGAYVLANLSQWLDDREMLATVFWRGFAAMSVILIGGLIAANWDRFTMVEPGENQ